MVERKTLLEVKGLRTYFPLDEGLVRAVDGAEFEIKQGQTLAVVGESGCGKSVTAQSILRIVPPPGRIVEGALLYHRYTRDGSTGSEAEIIDLAKLDPKGREIRSVRGNEIAMVFQEPMISLSPVHTIGNQIMESILLHQRVSKAEAREMATDMLQRVGMPKPSQTVDSYPFELSGGMRQRGMIAMALACHPRLLIADEPTTALDVTTEAQILDLLRQLQEELQMAILYITHNLGVVAEMADEAVVMYLGKVVERADVNAIFYEPLHPYTAALLRSIPRITETRKHTLEVIKGMVPDPYNLPSGCPFHPRCLSAREECASVEPPWVECTPGHWVRCVLY
ncbi:MAG: ABC transporter ATP-binding protein [Chloroflexi bacterium]|jgi:oligopeptide/dipeptide ABC transporter ATP-binding protein|nr:ABC transporter ATP-binding protein [Chloroflexota bacterium]